MEESLLIGAHTSTVGGLHNALLHGRDIGATTVQFFTSNQRRWVSAPLEDEAIALFKETLEETGLKKVMSHDSYLINLGAPDPEVLQKSRKAFKEELVRCQLLGISFLNFHPGSALKSDPELCLARIVESLLELEPFFDTLSTTRLLVETTAGQGSNMGWSFEHIGYIIDNTKDRLPVGVCMDTCHSFAAGYDIRTPKAWDATLDEFDKVVGLEHLCAFHVNDSLKGLGSRIDRHRPLGEGEIGIECFKYMMQCPRIRHIPKYLETPGGMELWEKEIKMLRKFAKEK